MRYIAYFALLSVLASFQTALAFDPVSPGMDDDDVPFFRNIWGSMWHKDAHDGPGGLWGPGGVYESDWSFFELFVGGDGMAYLAGRALEVANENGAPENDERCSQPPLGLQSWADYGHVINGLPGAGSVSDGSAGQHVGLTIRDWRNDSLGCEYDGMTSAEYLGQGG